MLSQKIKQTVLIALALAATACSTTTNRSATNDFKPVPTALLVKPVRPAPPSNGSPEALLNHAVDFGAYVKQLEYQLDGWIEWATQEREP